MSHLRANTISDAAGTGPVTLTKQSAAKAWVNFNGTGTIAARDSFNVSSLTDNATGHYSVNYTATMDDANYGAVCSGGLYTSAINNRASTTNNTQAASVDAVITVCTTGAFIDIDLVTAIVHGDLA
jgi:hypothetical protein